MRWILFFCCLVAFAAVATALRQEDGGVGDFDAQVQDSRLCQVRVPLYGSTHLEYGFR